MKRSGILNILIVVILSLQLISGTLIIIFLYNENYHYILSLSVYFFATFLIIALFGIGFIVFFPTFQKTNRVSRLNNIIYDLLQQSVYIKSQQDFFHRILESALMCIDQASKGTIMLMDPSSKKLSFVASIGYDMKILSKTFLELEQTYLYRESKGSISKTVKIHNPFEYDRKNIRAKNIDIILEAGSYDVKTTLSTPIYFEGKLYGMMNIDSKKVAAYDAYDIEIIELFAAEIVNVLNLFNSMEANEYHMNYDHMTRLPNRKHIKEIIKDIHDYASSQKKVYSLVAIDLDDLKETNNKYGDHIGDELLKSFASGFKQFLPEEGSIGRYGDDTFLVILPSYGLDETERLMLTVQEQFAQSPIVYLNESIPISFSYGIACYGIDGTDLQELLRIADQIMEDNKVYYHKEKEQQSV